ncbi:hypothetical protein JG687_00012179 [Phytophthora cactorum]|uniref:Uncharacterized protein n=1 Tax=Phytophthora cactorum TaxID=29920 RepID=A0A8T1U2P3_9STRA|nr:hypothetical protein JG687_00012179 [Phytophthora cactorum]
MYQFWSIYEDPSCDGAPTGVFILEADDCETHLKSSSGVNCVAQYDNNEELIGYIDESCYTNRPAGLGGLYNGEPYMAYDYFKGDACTRFGNSASYRISGNCEPLYAYKKNEGPYRSAKISVSDTRLVWTRNMGSMDGALNCQGPSGEGYNEFDVPIADINDGTCKNFHNIPGGFIFYNMSETVVESGSSSTASSLQSTSGSSVGSSNSASSSSAPESGLAAGTTIGLAGSGVVVLVGIIAMVYCCWKRHRKSDTGSMQYPFIDRGSTRTDGLTDASDSSTLKRGLWNDNTIIATRVPRDQCTALDSSSRPSAPMVVFRLQTIMKESFGEGSRI